MTRIAIQMDPPEGFNPQGDSTLSLGLEAQKRGAHLYYYHAGSLTFQAGTLTAKGHAITFHDNETQWFERGDEETLTLNEMNAVLIRQDPPFDMDYITSTYLLEALPESVAVINAPAAVRNLPEKWYALRDFSDLVPPTLLTRDANAMRDFLASESQCVLKPLYGYGGKGVFLLRQGGDNVESLIEHALATSREPWLMQRFLPEVKDQDRRVLLIGGKVSAVLGRIPAEGEIRANFRVGGQGETVSLTGTQQAICDRVGAALMEHGVLFAGLDLIGDWLTEINITSPTGIRIAQKMGLGDPAADFWELSGIL